MHIPMKLLLGASIMTALCLSVAARATTVTGISCKTDIPPIFTDASVPVEISFILDSTGKSLVAEVRQHGDVSFEKAMVRSGPVRAGLTAESSPEGLSHVERLVLHSIKYLAVARVSDQEFLKVDLSKVRFLKSYQIGVTTEYGQGSIIEALDENNVVIGKYLNFLIGVSNCQ